MSNRAARVTKADLARAMAVAKIHGMTVEVDRDGKIRIVPIESATGKVDYRGEIRL